MKKLVSVFVLAAMLVSMLAACGNSTAETKPVMTETTAPAVSTVEGTMEELLNKIVEVQPVEFMGGTMPIDLTDTSEDGLWNLKRFTGLDNADSITDAAAFEPMMGSMAFSMVMVRVAEGVDTKTVAEAMKAGIDPAKWVCVMADHMKVVSHGDVVMLIMLDSMLEGLTTQAFVDAFAQVVGEPAFEI